MLCSSKTIFSLNNLRCTDCDSEARFICLKSRFLVVFPCLYRTGTVKHILLDHFLRKNFIVHKVFLVNTGVCYCITFCLLSFYTSILISQSARLAVQ